MTVKMFFDTSILVYAHDVGAPAKSETAQRLILDAMSKGTGAISSQVLSEFYVTMIRKVKKPLSESAAAREVHLLSKMEVVEIDANTVERAIDLSRRWKVGYWDALILAAAEWADCHTVWSEDLADGQSYGRVTVRNPFKT